MYSGREVALKLSDLKPAEYNPRKISADQLKNLKKSIEEFGDLSGIVFNRRTGNVVGGHQRLKCVPDDAQIEKTGRICYGMEIDPHYCDVIVTRYCKYTGSNKIIKNGLEIEWPL